jgi:hypothetical protein
MYQIDSNGSVTTMPTPADAATPGWWTGGNPAIGEAATLIDPDWLNAVQAELLNILSGAGVSPLKGVSTQVLAALQILFAAAAGSATQKFNVAAATAAANAVNLGQFTGSIGTSGWQPLPGGLILQWGNFTASASAGAATPVTFPTPFESNSYAIHLTATNATTAIVGAWYDSNSTTGFNGHCSAASYFVSYMAIGK